MQLTMHARKQAELKGFSLRDVYAAAERPTLTYDNRRVPGQRRHIGNGIVAVVDPVKEVIITVYANIVETDVRPDQTDTDAQRYARERAARLAKQAQRKRERATRDRELRNAMRGRKG